MIFLNLFFTALITEIQITERVLWHPMACVPSCVLRLCGVVRRSVALKMRHSDIKTYQKHVLILIREIGKDPTGYHKALQDTVGRRKNRPAAFCVIL